VKEEANLVPLRRTLRLAPPQQVAERGKPKAKLQGGFSFGYFLWTEQRKERALSDYVETFSPNL
jgi:hypothetical protein